MAFITLLPKPKLWRAVLVGLTVLVGMGIVTVWNWYILDQRQQRDSQHRFDLDVATLSEAVEARMHAYEMVLRGISGVFTGDHEIVPYAQWNNVVAQLRVWDLYPGISSLVWSRYLSGGQVDAFVARNRADGRPSFQVFPDGRRDHYLPVEYIGPLNERTALVRGLDLLTQHPQSGAIREAIDSGRATLSMPLPDLYAISPSPEPETPRGMGVLFYFPVYRTGEPPGTVDARRTSVMGLTNAAFRGEELAQGIFGTQLRLFHIVARDVGVDLPLFDSRQVQQADTPPDWRPRFHKTLELPLYGRTWHLDITGTPEYEQALVARSQDLVLLMGLSMAALMAFLAGAFVWQRDRQMYASQQVSERLHHKAQQLMLANRYKSEFLANMSHELRTPLNSILILSDQLRQNAAGNLSEKQTRHADIIHRAGNDLLQLINDVLDLAKIEAGRIQINLEPLNLQDVLADLDAAMRPLAESKGLRLVMAPLPQDGSMPLRIHSDHVRLHQILRNLLSNAIKFTNTGEVRVEVGAGNLLEDGRRMLHVAVHDTGIGIAPEQHAQVFEAFQQLDGSTRRRFGGTGLGLAITRQLAQAMEGTIELASTPGEGSTFTVSLPVQVADNLPPGNAAPQRGGEGPALLIVEDDPNFAAIITEKAHSYGFSSVHCLTGQQALDLLRRETFAAVILDILLPDISGWQLFRRLRSEPHHRTTPVHIISCLPQPAGLESDHGTHYLTKPIGRDALEQVFSSLQHSRNTGTGPTLLLVEDVAEEREHYRQRLSALGFAVTACGSGQQACAAWAGSEFEVLVVDLNLPDQDGFALLDTLDSLRPLRGTRVVVNTGVDVNREGLQRLHGYSAVVVHKHGADTASLGQAVQGFLGRIGGVSAAAAAVVPPPSAAAPPVSARTLQGCRLLLVDDDVRNTYAMSAILDDFGFYVSTASNGEEAIAHYREEPLDIILMDMSMPVMDGYTATNLLKTQYGCTIPVIAVTAHAMKGDREKCLAAGADDYLAKPVTRQDLHAMLERWLLPAEGA